MKSFWIAAALTVAAILLFLSAPTAAQDVDWKKGKRAPCWAHRNLQQRCSPGRPAGQAGNETGRRQGCQFVEREPRNAEPSRFHRWQFRFLAGQRAAHGRRRKKPPYGSRCTMDRCRRCDHAARQSHYLRQRDAVRPPSRTISQVRTKRCRSKRRGAAAGRPLAEVVATRGTPGLPEDGRRSQDMFGFSWPLAARVRKQHFIEGRFFFFSSKYLVRIGTFQRVTGIFARKFFSPSFSA